MRVSVKSSRPPSSSVALGLSLGLSVALGACTSSFQWVKQGFSPPHADAKFASCQLEAERLRYSTAEPDEDRADRILHEARLCMKANGWRWVQTDGTQASDEPSDEPMGSTNDKGSRATGDSGSDQPSKQSDNRSGDKPEDEPDAKSDAKSDAKFDNKSDDKSGGGKDDDDDEDDD